MNIYRVDRAISPITPCDMNSICYTGNILAKAVNAFHSTPVGFNQWNAPDPAYGVILSVWNAKTQSYIVKRQKGF